MSGKFEKGDVFFAHVVEDADGGGLFAGETDDVASGAAEIALQRLDVLGRAWKCCSKSFLRTSMDTIFNHSVLAGPGN